MSFVEIKNLTKRWGDVTAVDNVSFSIDEGSFLTLLGPSGCGKTTILRMIAGLEIPTAGEISIGGRIVFSSEKRNLYSCKGKGTGACISELCPLAAYDCI